MHRPDSPEATIQRQLDAYNARDLDAWLATYAPGAKQYVFPAMLTASGIDEIRARSTARFQEPNLHAHVRGRRGHAGHDGDVSCRERRDSGSQLRVRTEETGHRITRRFAR